VKKKVSESNFRN